MRALGACLALLTFAVPATALEATYGDPTDPPEAELVKGAMFVSAMTFAPDGTLVWGELGGKVWRLDAGAKDARMIYEAPAVIGPEWGLTGVALPPDFAQTGDVFVAYVWGPEDVRPGADDARGEMRVVRVHEGNATSVYTMVATRSHNAGRLLVHDGLLYLTNGDHVLGMPAQDPAREEGKILRMTLDGKPAPGNPHETNASWHPYAFSMGHRNPYGLAWDPVRQRFVASEPGDHSDEEMNVVEAGGNYGWPHCAGTCDPPREGLIDPILVYPTVVTPVGLAVVGRDYYVGTFNLREVRRSFETPGGWTDEVYFKHSDGLLDLQGSPDGRWVYFGSWNGLWRIPTSTKTSFEAPTPTPSTSPVLTGTSPSSPPSNASASSEQFGTGTLSTLVVLAVLAFAAILVRKR